MAVYPKLAVSSQALLSTTFFLLALVAVTLADETGCPDGDQIVYSPFKPWFYFWPALDAQRCWPTASCVFIRADEARKQQFAATALVMGFIPITLKDIAWPERRVVNISQRLPFVMEVIVRALGLEPSITPHNQMTDMPDRVETERMAMRSGSALVRWMWKQEKRIVITAACLGGFFLVLSYAALAVVELYSKRSALGCVYPIFALTWYIVALIPALIHVAFTYSSRWNWNRLSSSSTIDTDSPTRQETAQAGTSRGMPSFGHKGEATEGESAIQGAGEVWFVQFGWAVYYVAGTLIWTSIMAVTVIELVVWFLCGLLVAGSSKLLAFFLCMAYEATGEGRHS